jgi:GDP-D-mannose dehydratase
MNLVIGKSSQLAHYFPEDYIKISSRKVNFDYLKSNKWNSAYLTFAEQRIYEHNIDYVTPNYLYTMEIINSLLDNTDKIVCYTSCELWNGLSGVISTLTPPNFNLTNEYTISKLLLMNKIHELQKYDSRYRKVIFMHPFYFNSVYRSQYFLLGKVFQSILNKEKIKVGNLNFERDMVHAKFVVNKSIESTTDCMIGSGQLFNVRDFVIDLYQRNNMNFHDFVEENKVIVPSGKEKLIMADVNWTYTYNDLISDTQIDIENFKHKGD